MTMAINYLDITGGATLASEIKQYALALEKREASNGLYSQSYAQTSFDTGRNSLGNYTHASRKRLDNADNLPASAVDLTESILKDAKLFSHDPGTIDRAIFSLVHWIDSELQNRATLSSEQQNVIRQVKEKVGEVLARGLVSFQQTDFQHSTLRHEACSFAPIPANGTNILQMRSLANALMSM